jgi:hypothetical protein
MILPRPAVKTREVVDKPPIRPENRPMPDSRALLLTLALEATPTGVSRFARFCRQKSAYVATLVYKPDDFEPGAFIETDSGIDVCWRYRGNPRLTVS